MSVVLEGVTIRYGDRVAADGLSVTFDKGAVALLGRNGAGKSSVLRALLGLVAVSAGSVRFSQLPANAPPSAIRAVVGYMPERDAYLPQASGFEMVAMLGMLSGLSRRDAWRRAHEVLYLVGLEEQRYRAVSGYSAGMRQKVKLAAALVHDPAVLFLDEPTNGLDPTGRREMLALVRQLSQELGKSIVFSTHILQDVESVCDSAVLLERGRVAAQGPLVELTRSSEREYRLRVESRDLGGTVPSGLLDSLGASGSGRAARSSDGSFSVWLTDGISTQVVFAAVQAAGCRVRSMQLQRRSLEQVFLDAIRRTGGGG